MNPSRASRTAARMALSRAIETREPPRARICDDPFAERFLDRRERVLIAARPSRRAIVALIERLFAGHHHYVLARTRYFDDFLASNLEPSVRQLVILGAGFDSRAYRFANRLHETAVFEVDHPATSGRKRAKLEAIFGRVPAGVHLAPVDFDREDLGAALARHGFRTGQPTLYLWEGTVPYLSAAAVDETLRFVVDSSAPGSRVILDYVLRSVLDGRCDFRGAATELARMRQTSEPFTFGIDAEKIADFLGSRGFHDVRDAGGEQLKASFPAERRGAYVKPWWRIAYATVQ
jgi:methyltransferase (TIGR00027 family)